MITNPYPDTVYIGITDKCNANCVICWRRAVKQEFLDFDKEFLEKIIPFLENVKVIGWWGDGELFAHSEIQYILNKMRQLSSVKHRFSTNGKKLLEYANDLSDINIDEIIVSIDGATEGTLSRIRVGVHLDDIKQGIYELYRCFNEKRRQMPKLIFAFTSMMSNIYELPEMVELAKELKVGEIRVQPLNPHHSNLIAEDLSVVAPGIEKKYFDKASMLGDIIGVKVTHCNEEKLSITSRINAGACVET